MQYLIIIKQFVSENQLLLTTALLIASYFLKRFIDHKAADPAVNIYDTIKPGSDALYSLVHKAIEKRAVLNPMSSEAKLMEYMEQVQKFEQAWKSDRLQAVQQLMAWYLSIKAKDVAANPSEPPLTADSVAIDESSKT
jgi:hypothetical protein